MLRACAGKKYQVSGGNGKFFFVLDKGE